MYARYIPPSKSPKAAAESKHAASASAPTSSTQAPARSPADGFSYARYVPGAKPAKKLEAAPTIKYFNDEPSPPNPKRKRETDGSAEPHPPGSKRSKTEEQPNGVTQVAARDDKEPRQEEAGPEKKKNKRKRKQRTRASDDDTEESENELPNQEPPRTEPRQVEASETQMQVVEEDKPDKKQREKKRSRSKPEAEQAQRNREAQDDVAMADAEAAKAQPHPAPELKVVKEKKTKDKEKKEKKAKAEAENAQASPEQEQEDPRHKAVLERKAKSLKLASKVVQDAHPEPEEPAELHGLEPLPQPAVVEDDESKPTYETLPSWLATPIRVSQHTRVPFTDLGILPRQARFLEQKGFAEAFAVQTAAIPLLLPTSKRRAGDVLISAATGSGKTLAYALPIVRDISQGVVTRLRALVVLPTRELVKQAQEVFDICARAYDGEELKRVRIGMAVGSQSIQTEQQTLMESESRYNPEAYREIQEQNRQRRAQRTASADVDDMLELGADDKDPRLGAWEGEVVDFSSKVDVLICTPGRLVEHIEQTPGFSLDYVRWLVVDEADKLLAQSFQGWLDLVMEQFKANRFSARDFADMEYSGVRKVVLSATLTRDLSLLNQLGLRRPQLVVLESEGAAQTAEHTLPASLREFAVRVHETNLKPLYLLDLIRGPHMDESGGQATMSKESDVSDSDSSPGSDTGSDGSSDGGAKDGDGLPKRQLPHSLIFTKSTESALRLSRLLVLLDGSLAAHMSTITSTTPTHIRRKTLRAFATASSPVRLIVASDLVARGIDIPKLGHVINYDLPASVAGYVHRVGRTARAGRSGCAWTLVGDEESGWFWGKIAKGQGVRRAHKVERTRIEEMSEERVKEYEDALAKLGQEAQQVARR